MLVLADVAVGPTLALGGVVALLVGGLVVLVEAVGLLALRWGSFPRCLLHALVINLVSALPGMAGAYASAAFSKAFLNLPPPPFGILVMGGAFAATVLVEAPVLWFMSREPWPRVWKAALLVNVVSYVVLTGVLYALSNSF